MRKISPIILNLKFSQSAAPETRTIRSVAEVVRDDSGAPLKVMGVIQDITDQKKLEKALTHARKMETIGTLTGGIAHEFNNILYIIIGHAELLLEDTPTSNPVHGSIMEIKDASLRAAGIVRQLLKIGRKTESILIPINAIKIIQESVEFIRSSIPVNIDVRMRLPNADCKILADQDQINQVLTNLCINAAQAMDEAGGVLKVSAEGIALEDKNNAFLPGLTAGEYLKITVADTGPGIEPENIDRIFDPYFTTKAFGKGSGLGLAVVNGIVKNHGGAITVDSQPGKGASFTVFFKKVPDKSATNVTGADKMPSGDETILFVDD